MSGLDIQLEKSEYASPVRKKIGCRCEIRRVIFHFFMQLIRTNVLMVKVSRRETGDMVQFLMSAKNLCHASAILRGTEPVSALTRALSTLLRSL